MKEQSAAGILETTIEKVKNLVNVSTIIGEPMNICLLYTSPSPRDRG